MKDEASARKLAEALVRVGTGAGKHVVALLTEMNAPLGEEVGNATETREAIEVLHGRGPADLVECTLALGAEMLVLGKKADDVLTARTRLRAAIANGSAARTMERMIEAQHGDTRVVAEPSRLEVAPISVPVLAERAGVVQRVDALTIGRAAVAMGAGRSRAEDKVDHAVGISVHVKPGARVEMGHPLATLRVRADAPAILERVRTAFVVGDGAVAPRPLVIGRIDGRDTA
jgi:thymidine phosphorylase